MNRKNKNSFKISKKESRTCKICGAVFKTHKLQKNHINKIHNLSWEEYVIKIYYNNEWPTCRCGCGTKLTFKGLTLGPWFTEYTRNHWPKKKHTEETKKKISNTGRKTFQTKYGVDNIFSLDEIKIKTAATKAERYGDKNYNNIEKIKETKLNRYGDKNYNNIEKIKETNLNKIGVEFPLQLEKIRILGRQTKLQKYNNSNYNNMEKTEQPKVDRYGYKTEFINPEFRRKHNNKISKWELIVSNKLNGQHKFIYKNKEFDIKLDDTIIEIDGDFWHPSKLEELTISQINTIINDYQKNKIIANSKYEMIRIHTSKIPEQITLKNIKDNSYNPDYTINYNQKIITKEYFKHYIDTKGPEKLEKYVPLLLKFIRTLHPEFPSYYLKEDFNTIVNKIKNYDLSRIMIDNNTFNNNCSLLGVNYLKSKFNSYWKSTYKNNISPVEAWYNDDIMLKVIKYRIGINSSNEIFDFSIKELINGLSARRHTVSFFKPLLAASIYKFKLGNMENPIVIDPCAGFGGRLLAFKALYPNGTYIGIEPNIETFNELSELKNMFIEGGINADTIKLYNCTLEEYSGTKQADLTFTSIPYYDLEIYSNSVEYKDFEDWKDKFIYSLCTYPNPMINMSMTLMNELNFNNCYNMRLATSHFNKETKYKYEGLTDLSIKK